ncbi:MAG: D-alanyl-D-alanine carboxypeptidase/D-alanyl-D-alanine-endopeptidase [Dysgonamonadaceae bacterium]|nr:D-alanyl-D-alanine carboxypeptidase/D-alanyl-D-alanine-endopeptidase [Dysgonamonadaceae bacterium]
MNSKNLFSILFCLIFFNSLAVNAKDNGALQKFLGKKELAHAAVSLKAVDLTTGKAVVSYNEKMALTPASNMKLATTALALDFLSEDFCYVTPLFYDGYIEDSTLCGNIFIRGTGDPSLGSEFTGEGADALFEQWTSAVKNAGIKRIEGNVVILDQLFGYEGVSHKWLLEDLGWYYGAPVFGISIFDNMCRIFFKSGNPGSPTEITGFSPQIENLQFRNEITASDVNDDESEIFGYPLDNVRVLKGKIPPFKENFVVKGDIPDPGSVLAEYFYNNLITKGIEITGQAVSYRTEPQLPTSENLIFEHKSPKLSELAREINLHSNNNYAEHLYKRLARLDSIDASKYFQERGLDAGALFQCDGSGLSPQNAVSAGFLIELLIYMDKKYGRKGAFFQSLPIAGKEGTVASFLRNTPLSGKARLKSGSMSGVQAYSGYVETGSKRYAVSFIVNNFSGKRADLRKAMEELLAELF